MKRTFVFTCLHADPARQQTVLSALVSPCYSAPLLLARGCICRWSRSLVRCNELLRAQRHVHLLRRPKLPGAANRNFEKIVVIWAEVLQKIPDVYHLDSNYPDDHGHHRDCRDRVSPPARPRILLRGCHQLPGCCSFVLDAVISLTHATLACTNSWASSCTFVTLCCSPHCSTTTTC